MTQVTQLQPKTAQLSAAILAAFFSGSDAKLVAGKVAEVQQSRMLHLFGMFENSDLATVKVACKEYKADAKAQAADKKVPKVATTRAGEVQSLYGAWRFAEFSPKGYGYHDAVAASREVLKAKGIRWDGNRVPETWEREAKAEVEGEAKAKLAATLEIGRRERAGETLTGEQKAEVVEKATLEVQRAKMTKLAGAIVRKYGAEQAEYLIEALEGAITAAIQAEQDKAATQEQAAA